MDSGSLFWWIGMCVEIVVQRGGISYLSVGIVSCERPGHKKECDVL